MGTSSSIGTSFKGSSLSDVMLSGASLSSFVATLPSIPSFETGRLAVPNISNGKSISAGSSSSSTNTSGSDSNSSLPTDPSLSAGSDLTTLDDMDAGPSSSSPSSVSKIGTCVKRLIRRCRGRKEHTEEEENDLTSPGVMVDRSEFDWAVGIEFFDNRAPYHAIGWDGQPMKPKGPWAQLVSIPKLYWQLRMAKMRGEA